MAETRVSSPPSAPEGQSGEDLRRLGEALKARTEDVVAGMVLRTQQSGHVLDGMVEERFARVGTVSTVAVARWMAGEGPEVAREVGREAWHIFGQLAAQRAAPLNEVTKRCLRWCDAAEDVVREIAAQLELSREAALLQALDMLQRSLNVTLVRMCESFEAERQRADEELARRQEELAFMATHDALTGLPNRTLILDRIEQMLVRSRRHQAPVAALFIDLDNFKSINDTLGHDAGDELLQAVAARLDGVVRATDALGRLGGDEFVVIAEELSLAAGPELLAERLLEALKQPFTLAGAGDATTVTVTASIGIAAGDRASAERSAARRRHRDVPREVGRQEPLRRVRVRDAGRGPAPDGARDGPARRPGERRVLPRLPTHIRPAGHEPHRNGGPDPLEQPDTRGRSTR